MLIDPSITENWRDGEKREVAWGLSVGRVSPNARAGWMRGSLYLWIPLLLELEAGCHGAFEVVERDEGQRKGEGGAGEQAVSPSCQGEDVWRKIFTALTVPVMCMPFLCICGYPCGFYRVCVSMHVCPTWKSGSCKEVGITEPPF